MSRFDRASIPAERPSILAIDEGYADVAIPLATGADACQARLRLYGRYLVAEDNRQCGGMNVSFFGTYIRLS